MLTTAARGLQGASVIADRNWVKRTLDFDPIDAPPPARTYSFCAGGRSYCIGRGVPAQDHRF